MATNDRDGEKAIETAQRGHIRRIRRCRHRGCAGLLRIVAVQRAEQREYIGGD
jgi:hypothetical protein